MPVDELDSTHRELSPINRVYTERGTRSEFGDKKEKEEKKREQRLERSRERGRMVLQELKGFGLGGVVTMRK